MSLYSTNIERVEWGKNVSFGDTNCLYNSQCGTEVKVAMSYVIGYASKHLFLLGSDTRCTWTEAGPNKCICHYEDNEKKIFVHETTEGQVAYSLTGSNRFGPKRMHLMDLLRDFPLSSFKSTTLYLLDKLCEVSHSEQECQLICVPTNGFLNPWYIETKGDKFRIEVQHMNPGKFIVTGESYARELTLRNFPNMESLTSQEQADTVHNWISSMAAMDNLLPDLFSNGNTIGGKPDIYIIRRNGVFPYTC